MQAFGLDITGGLPLDTTQAPSGGRAVDFEVHDVPAMARRWPSGEAEVALERHYPNGSLGMRVERHPEAGYRVYAPRHGRHVIAPDGTRVACALPNVAAWRWQRLLFAQVLPICAALQGLEVLHASAVTVGGRAYAFSGSPGVGKTSLSLHLAARGAQLLTDDVVALEVRDDDVIAHAGPPTANVRFDQIGMLAAAATVRGRADKAFVRHDGLSGPAPLRGLFLLARRDAATALTLDAVDPPDPRVVLGSTFVPHVTAPGRLLAQLELADALTRVAQVTRVTVPTSLAVEPTAEALMQRLLSDP